MFYCGKGWRNVVHFNIPICGGSILELQTYFILLTMYGSDDIRGPLNK